MQLLSQKLTAAFPEWNATPVDLAAAESLCETLGIIVEEMPLEVDGMYFQALGRSVIAVNSRLPAMMRLKILLHEIGHLLLHAPASGVGAAFHDVGMRTRQEFEADLFAVCAILPRTVLLDATRDSLLEDGFPADLIDERENIARTYGI